MRLAILANTKNSFVRPLAEGLARMATAAGATPEIIYDGLEILSLPLGILGGSLRGAPRRALTVAGNRRRYSGLVERLATADVIVVVAHVPGSFARDTLPNVESLRRSLPETPIVNYDLVYLPTVEKWGAAMLRGEESGLIGADLGLLRTAPFGMERYDWYLAVSSASEIPMPDGAQPLSEIGIDIDDGSLYPDQGSELQVLVDFEQTRKDYPSYRHVQLAALEKAGIPFRVLEGSYTRVEIRAIFRKSGVFMLAHRESFGLPICEVQACGALVFTPRAEWAGAHWIKEDSRIAGPGLHSPNIVVYQNTVDGLVRELHRVRDSFDPSRVVKQFLESHPQLFRGNVAEMSKFLSMVDSGAVHSRLHEEHATVGRRVFEHAVPSAVDLGDARQTLRAGRDDMEARQGDGVSGGDSSLGSHRGA